MTSKYLHPEPRTLREAEIDRLCAELKSDHPSDKTDGCLTSVRRLLEYAEKCARKYANGVPLDERACESAVDMADVISDMMMDYLVPAEESAREYFDREEVE